MVKPDGNLASGGGPGVWEGDSYTPKTYANLSLTHILPCPQVCRQLIFVCRQLIFFIYRTANKQSISKQWPIEIKSR